jgi:hypothetical protein
VKETDSTRRGFLTAIGTAAAGSALATSAFAKDLPRTPRSERFLQDLSAALLANCTADPVHERVLIRITRGTGLLSDDRQYITLDMAMYTVNGRPDGYHQGVWHALFSTPLELLAVPPQPVDPLNRPVGPVDHLSPLADTKAIWAFGDGSKLYAEGPALSHLVPYGPPGASDSHFSVACSQVLTQGGTGHFAGAYGLKQSLGATFVPKGVNFFDPSQSPKPFTATTIDTFRIVWPGGVPQAFDRQHDFDD